MQNWKMADQFTGLENDGLNRRDGKGMSAQKYHYAYEVAV